ncbi:MAG: acyltransferase family protein [Clostridia bacterium]|nr:acyltransferase family protein [Clostridia bacterium]
MFYHLHEYMNLGSFVDGSYRISITQIILALSPAAIPLFFVANGALLLNKEYSTEKMYTKAAKVALIILVWKIVDFPSWFMETLIILFLLYPILNKLDKAKNKIWRNLVMLALLVFPFIYNFVMVCFQCWWPDFSIVILGRTLSLETMPLKSGFYTLYSILYFLLGGIMFRKKINNIISTMSLLVGWILVIFDVIVSSNYSKIIQDTASSCIPTIGGLLITIGFFNLFRNLDKVKSEKFKSIISKLGQYVMPIYLFHMHIIWKVFRPFFPSNVNVFLLLLCAIANYFVCIILGMILKKIPLVKELLKM